MKLSANTVKILENFAKINNQFLFVKGKTQKTMTGAKSFLASAEIDEDIPQDFGIYKLSQFLSLYSLFNDPEIKFESDHLVLKEGDREASYVYCSPSVISSPPKDKKIPINNPLFSFELSEDQLTRFLSSSRILQLPNLIFAADDGQIKMSLSPNDSNKSKDSYSEKIAVDTEATDGTAIIEVESLNILPDDYTVTVTAKIVHFKSQNRNIEYFAVVTA